MELTGRKDQDPSATKRQIKNRTLENWNARCVEGIEAVRCTFIGRMPLRDAPGDWNIVRDCRAVRCSKNSLGLSGVAFEDCEIKGYGSVGRFPLFLYACVFARTILRGALPHISFKPYYLTPGTLIDLPEHDLSVRYDADIQRQWERAMLSYYERVDWALDIREARFQSFMTFPGVPGDLILRDPKHQILVRRLRVTDGRLRDAKQGAALRAIDHFLRYSPFESLVMAAPRIRGQKEDYLRAFRLLRDLGIAEPR